MPRPHGDHHRWAITTGDHRVHCLQGNPGGEGWGKGPEEMDWKGPGACPEGWGMGWTGGLLDSGGRSHLLSWRGPVEKSRLHFGRASEIKAESPPLRGEA